MIPQTPSGFKTLGVSQFPYQLEKSPKKKGDCPQCGHKGQFRYYEDHNGDRIESAGKCERVNSCDYHVKPNKEQLPKEIKPKPEPLKIEIIFPDKSLLAKIERYEKDQSSNFHKFCTSLEIPLLHLEKWGVGTDGKFTVFTLRNKDNRIANIKKFSYLDNGKRDKNINSFSLKQPSKAQKYGIPLFGEHLLDAEKNKIVCVVESEKSAVICSYFYPDFDIVACGAANGLTAEKLPVLFGRKIYWLADADEDGRVKASSIKNLKAYKQNFEVIDLFPERNDGFDLADAIIEKVEVPSFDQMIKKTELVDEKSEEKKEESYNKIDFKKFIDSHRVTTKSNYKPMHPVICIGDSVFGVNGDISFISGPPKAGKSTITRFMIATALVENLSSTVDTLTINSKFCGDKKIVYLDTEMNPSDTKKMVHSIMEIANLDKEPENLIALNFRELSHKENRDNLTKLFDYYSDAYLWILDGITDFLPSANDEVVSNELIRFLMKMSTIHDTCIVCLIHENSGTTGGKMRGHIGSEAARKCQGAISVNYEEHIKVHSIKSSFLRGSKKIEPIYWEYNDKKRPVSCDAALVAQLNSPEIKDIKKASENLNILEKIYGKLDGKGLTIDLLKTQIKMHMEKPSGVKDDSLRKSRDRIYKAMEEQNLIISKTENVDGMERKVFYYNNPKGLQIDFLE